MYAAYGFLTHPPRVQPFRDVAILFDNMTPVELRERGCLAVAEEHDLSASHPACPSLRNRPQCRSKILRVSRHPLKGGGRHLHLPTNVIPDNNSS